MKALVSLFSLVVTFSATAWSADSWPQSFRIICGDLSPEVVDATVRDPRMALVVLEGQATRIPPGELTGYLANGLGYTVTGTLSDKDLTGMGSLAVRFICGTRDLTEVFGKSLECLGDIPFDGLPTVPGFSQMRATLPMPIRQLVAGPGTVTVRRAKIDRAYTPPLKSYYQNVRELTCKYAL